MRTCLIITVTCIITTLLWTPTTQAKNKRLALVGKYVRPMQAGHSYTLQINQLKQYTWSHSACPGSCAQYASKGYIKQLASRITFQPAPGTPRYAVPPTLTMRRHLRRTVLLFDHQVAAFDLLPSYGLGLVTMQKGEDAKSFQGVLKKHTPTKNPKGSALEPALPRTFSFHALLPGKKANRHLNVNLKMRPYTVTLTGCIAAIAGACKATRRIKLTANQWAELTQNWWKEHRPSGCITPIYRKATRPYTFTINGKNVTRKLPAARKDVARYAGSACRPLASMAWLIIRAFEP